ncbi:MAG: hypothetical protein A3K19_10900 [Lentisphaerae bacterium RIFOXYB12_FULL_65_16]|nr:MAG: hypothetical protein A3K18_18105 [Lentisphaerae bacterium RIFOXYA12_64_32]OGV87850.1 MAG: hypothetical protein A3K19_10900 [Lentisphaerae bacterium RIFOXYB12_FULL_65_16]
MSDRQDADLILTDARVLTLSEACPVADSVAVRGDRIVAVGTAAEVQEFRGPRTVVLSLNGAMVIPGLIDTHAHVSRVGDLVATHALLYDCTSIADLVARLSRHRDRIPDGAPVHGKGDCFHARHFAEKRQVCAEDLDQVATDRPVAITDVNKTIVNSFALDHCISLAALGDSITVPIDKRTGRPTGAFPVAAQAAVKVPAHTVPMTLADELVASTAEFARCGVTTAVDAQPPLGHIRAYCAASQAGQLHARVVIMPAMRLVEDASFRAEFSHRGSDGPLHAFGPAKELYDRFVMHRSAYMREPYLGDPTNCGATFLSFNDLCKRAESVWRHGWPLGIHVTGDRALAEAAGLMRRLCCPPVYGLSHVIHAYFPSPDVLRGLCQAHIGAAVQPGFLSVWGETLRDLLGDERACTFLPLQAYLAAGVTLGGGSDAPISHWNPFPAMAAAMTRRTLGGTTLDASQALSSQDALRLYTTTAAELLGLGDRLGSIAPGKLGDLVVLDRDIAACSPEQLAATRVTMTVVAGRVVYRAADGALQHPAVA